MARNQPGYDQIRMHLLQKNALFEDPEFPAVTQSTFFSVQPITFEWKRPSELCEHPQMFVGGASRLHIAPGQLGDCCFIAALAVLTLDEQLLFRVVPPEQSFTEGYAGIFKFNFWQYGEWKEIIIDDRLPTFNGSLVFVHSTKKNEFWSALLEKAYAKLHGSYESLERGNTIKAIGNFTGGISESFSLRDMAPKSLFRVLLKAYERDAIEQKVKKPEPTPQQTAPLDTEIKSLEDLFKKLAGNDMEVDAWELQEVLNTKMKNEFHSGSFTLESCKSMIALSDTDRNGKLGFEEFVDLLRDLMRWRNIFQNFDKDNSGSFSTNELSAAMTSAGYRMNAQLFGAIVLRYGDRNNEISFNSFISCAIKLKNMFDVFNDNREGNKIFLTLNETLMVNIYS